MSSIYRDKYKIGNVDFFNIRNRNEGRVIKALQEVVQKKSGELLTGKDLQDIYALALNALPSRYAQRGTIVLRDSVTKREIYEAVEDAYDRVVACPKP
ncbi:MAG: late competence development ComFB family protein [Betaproteobacteria bacterium]|nr:late competence development ComFB family protein [Betaproteobacteria bacterium]